MVYINEKRIEVTIFLKYTKLCVDVIGVKTSCGVIQICW